MRIRSAMARITAVVTWQYVLTLTDAPEARRKDFVQDEDSRIGCLTILFPVELFTQRTYLDQRYSKTDI